MRRRVRKLLAAGVVSALTCMVKSENTALSPACRELISRYGWSLRFFFSAAFIFFFPQTLSAGNCVCVCVCRVLNKGWELFLRDYPP